MDSLLGIKVVMDYINSLYPTIKFTLVYSESSLNVLDLTLKLKDGYIRPNRQIDWYSKPTDNQLYLEYTSAHPRHWMKAIPYGVATRLPRNCYTEEDFQTRCKEYKGYLSNRYCTIPKKQFNKASRSYFSKGTTDFKKVNQLKRFFPAGVWSTKIPISRT